MNDPAPLPTSTFRAMLVLALPVLAEESLNLLVGYTDWFLAGNFLVGREPLAAMGLMAYVMWMLPSLFSVVGIGALAVIARLVGAGQRADAAHVARQALLVGCLAAVIGMLLAFTLGGYFVAAMQLRGEAAALALRYIRIIAPVIPLVMIEQVGTACLRGAGDTVSGLIARVVVNIVNVLVSVPLVTGLGPFPQLGWDGLAIGTAVGHSVGGLIVLWRLTGGRGGLSLLHDANGNGDRGQRPSMNRDHWSRLCTWDRETVRRILRIGVPGGIDVWAVLTCHLIYVAIINSLGTLAQAAHGLGIQLEALSYLPGSAFSVAAATLAGQALGAANQQRAVRSVLQCAAAAIGVMTLAALVLFFGGEALAKFFIGEKPDTLETAILTGRLLKIVAFSCPFLAVLMVLSGALRGSGDTRFTLLVTFIGLVTIRLPAACFLAWDEIPLPFTDAALPALGLGVVGAWWAMVADVVIRSFLAAGRFLQGGWQKVRV